MGKITFIPGASDGEIADWLEAHLGAALAAGNLDVPVTVPGGATPFPILEALTKAKLEWPRLTVWPGDDRIVGEDHPASNVGRIRALFEPLGARVVALSEDAEPPRFALTWLGMGGDGHIASLFPNVDPRADDRLRVRRLTPDPLPLDAPFERLSLTLPALLNSDELLFVIRGEDKRGVFEAAARGDNDLPVARLLKAAPRVTCFC